MTQTIRPKWGLHSFYLGVPIYKRLSHTGTWGGQWLTANTYCDSLRQAKEELQHLADIGLIHHYAREEGSR